MTHSRVCVYTHTVIYLNGVLNKYTDSTVALLNLVAVLMSVCVPAPIEVYMQLCTQQQCVHTLEYLVGPESLYVYRAVEIYSYPVGTTHHE